MSSGLAPALEWCDVPGPRRRVPRQRELLTRAIQQRPDSVLLHVQLGDVLLRAAEYEDAARAFARAVELGPGDADAALGLGNALAGRALAKAGRDDAALAELRAALVLNPSHFQALHALARLLVDRRDYAGILAECETSLARAPGNSAALALKSQALLALGHDDAARELLDVDRFARIDRPEQPPSAAGAESFLAALERSLRASPGLEFEPEHRTARGGSRADLRPTPRQPEAMLRDMIQEVVQAYRRSLLDDTSHPFAAAAPNRASLVMWTNILSAGGYHTPHVHPAAWLSGVYYVRVPGGAEEHRGTLELACTEPMFKGHANPLMRPVLPEPGMLVLFPSYFYHRTLPIRSAEERIAVAFDVVAER